MEILQKEIEKAYKSIELKRKRPWKGEEEVRIAWVSALEAVLNIHFDAERANKDSSYNHVIIEFKAPGLFKGSKNSQKFKEATEKRLLPYIIREAKKSAIPAEDYIGIAIDGEHICFAQIQNDKIITQHLLAFSAYSFKLVVQAIHADTRRAINIENLIYDFSHGSQNTQTFMQVISDALAQELNKKDNSKIRMLFVEWRTLYAQVADMSILHIESINREICFRWKGAESDSISGRLFVIHSYNSLLIKLFAAEIVSAHNLTSIFQPAQAMASMMDNDSLIRFLEDEIEHANLFTQAGINGFVEEAIFSWYLDVAKSTSYKESICGSLRDLLIRLSLYRTDKLSNTRDVLRDLYQALVPGKLRQSLGEFYTPDWLVDFTINSTSKNNWLEKRVLDPTCGSGAFLISLIRRKIKEAEEKGWHPKKILKNICSTVWGFDLNPLAVQTSRVNFLMEIAQLMKKCEGETIELPILLADAIYSPAPDPKSGDKFVRYQIGSSYAGLDIRLPAPLAFNRYKLDQTFKSMAKDVESNYEYKKTEKNLVQAKIISLKEAKDWYKPLKFTYDQILKLHRQQWNGIWFRVVRNFFWSATAGRFDCIVGNPPWVRWSKLPAAYRDRVKPTCEEYGIFSKTKRHGGNELDISAMITYTTADKWLKNNGLLSFVITGAIFKNPSSAGFRHFELKDKVYLVPTMVSDLKQIKPFPDATNHTTVMCIEKRKEPPKYPVIYNVWKSKKNFPKSINPTITLEELMEKVNITALEAIPVDKKGSPWAVLKKGRYDILKILSGKSDWIEGRKGITTDLNGVYFVPIIKNNGKLVQIRSRPEAGKKEIGNIKKAWIEPNLLYPLVKGAGDFEPCYFKLNNNQDREVLYTLLPNMGIGQKDYDACEKSVNSVEMEKTKKWFSGYKELLLKRSTFRRQMQGAPFYAVYNVGEYTFSPWKVIWPEMASKFYSAVVGSYKMPVMGHRPFIPDHKIYYVGLKSKGEANFLCGLLNSFMVSEWVESHNVSIQMGDIFKHMSIPKYNKNEKSHVLLSQTVEQAHNEHDKTKRNLLLKKVRTMGDSIILKSKFS